VINGPMIWSPDSSALFGPVPELRNYFCCNGIIPGFSQSGGLGLLSAEWIVTGEPKLDMFGWDLARFGRWAGKDFTKARVRDQYANRFKIHFPNEERAAGRPVRTRPIYGAKGDGRGLWPELWLGASACGSRPPASRPRKPSALTGRTGGVRWAARRGCLRDRAGIIDISNFARYRITGPGARTGWMRCWPTACPRFRAGPALRP
jgi:dimethylglycine dehydrogenase